jgi:amidase
MLGKDESDEKSVAYDMPSILSTELQPKPFDQMRLGAMSTLMETDSIYAETVKQLKALGAQIIEFTPPETQMEGFLSILNIDMRNDLPTYLKRYADPEKVKIKSIADAVAFNAEDSLVRIPYGQPLFEGILADSTTTTELDAIKLDLENKGRAYFDVALDSYGLDAVLSINNYHAGYAAVAKYPALTVPMGYKDSGEPIGLTFIGKPFSEAQLLRLGMAYEEVTKKRKLPSNYQ